MAEQYTELDRRRLRKQLETIRDVMLSAGELGVWHTLGELHKLTGYPPASISADLRHLRKPRHGGWVVEKRRRGAPAAELWEYRVRRNAPSAADLDALALEQGIAEQTA